MNKWIVAYVVALLGDCPLATYLALVAVVIVLALTSVCVLVVLVRDDDGAEVLRAVADVVRAVRGR